MRRLLPAIVVTFVLPVSAFAQWQPNGAPLTTAEDSQYETSAVTDGGGGAIVVWTEFRSRGTTKGDIYGQRITNTGNVLWNANGVAICTRTGTQDIPQIALDGAGGAIVVWREAFFSKIYAQKLNASGGWMCISRASEMRIGNLTSNCCGSLGGLGRMNGQCELSEYERVLVGAPP